MRRHSWPALMLVCFVGCAAPGSRPDALTSQTPPQTPATQVAGASTNPGESANEGFSFSKMFQMVGFPKPEAPAPSLVPQEVANLGNIINTVTARSAELNVNDPPEVTRQKAQAILDSLQGWDNTLAASNSTGFVNNEMAQTLNGWVGHIRVQAQQLVQYLPNPETIAAIQQLAGSLNSTFGTVGAMVNQGNTVSQAFLGANRG